MNWLLAGIEPTAATALSIIVWIAAVVTASIIGLIVVEVVRERRERRERDRRLTTPLITPQMAAHMREFRARREGGAVK